MRAATYKGQLGDNYGQYSQEINDKVCQVVVRIVRAEKEEHNRNTQQELFRWSVLGAIVDLFPHVQIIKGTAVEFKGDAADVMKHDVRAKHVGHVGQGPRCLLRDAGDDVVEDLEGGDEDDVNCPSS